MAKRKNIPKTVRFEVFKRDSFKCQYCGETAPDVVLHVDHIVPVKEDGTNEIMNLITSCAACNLGKSANLLSDNSTVKKQKKQLDELNERRQQLEMMNEWRKGLLEIENEKFNNVYEIFIKHTRYDLNESGKETLKKIVRKYPYDIVIESTDASINQYLKFNSNGKADRDSVEKTFDMIGRICSIKIRQKETPWLSEIYYAKGILRNRFSWTPSRIKEAAMWMEKIVIAGGSPEAAKQICRQCNSYNDFLNL